MPQLLTLEIRATTVRTRPSAGFPVTLNPPSPSPSIPPLPPLPPILLSLAPLPQSPLPRPTTTTPHSLTHSLTHSRYDSWGLPFFCFVGHSLHFTMPRQVLVQPIFDVHGRRRGHVAFRRKATPQEYDAAPDRLRPLARAAGDLRCGRELLADAARDRTATLERCDRPEPFPTGS